MTQYFCCDERRRSAVRAHGTLNGIDFLEVADAGPDAAQRRLRVQFVKPIDITLTPENVRIEGGERIRDIHVTSVSISADEPDVLIVEVDQAGDFSPYALRLVSADEGDSTPPGIDRLLAAVEFSFKVDCASDFDCVTDGGNAPEPPRTPEIDYLAKDFASFRQLMLDRLAVVLPDWQERNPADLGITLVELLAYVGDYLSYRQDAIATEAYLDTARSRVSVRRHARLVDYFMHDGVNARTWVQLGARTDHIVVAAGTQLLTRTGATDSHRIEPGSTTYRAALTASPVIFETMHDVTLFAAHNAMPFYTWGARECCLPTGSTEATLRGHFPDLRVGDILMLVERIDPETGLPDDADPQHRHAVRLTRVDWTQDDLGGRFLEEPNDDPVSITEIEWHDADALPFSLCISARIETGDTLHHVDDVSMAHGNIVLADHGLTVQNEPLGVVPPPKPELARVPVRGGEPCEPTGHIVVPPRYRPTLSQRPLTFAESFDYESLPSASAAMQQNPRAALPAINLRSQTDDDTDSWEPRRDLLASAATATEFVVEVETDLSAQLRFGDNQFGRRPPPGTTFSATYRVGSGQAGNIGANALTHIVSSDADILSITNPLPARGGTNPESLEQVQQLAPYTFRQQERAITADDYAKIATAHPAVQQAAATLRWTGSWYTVFLTIDRLGGGAVDAVFETEIRRYLDRFRLAGHDIEIDSPRYVSLEIELRVCVAPDYFRSQIREALLETFSNRVLPGGARGLFHPDNYTFGQSVYLSQLYAAAETIEGIESVEITTLQRQGVPGSDALETGKLELRRLEIARLDNDPNFPEHGVLRITLEGGK